jgi:hypothetical protein
MPYYFESLKIKYKMYAFALAEWRAEWTKQTKICAERPLTPCDGVTGMVAPYAMIMHPW